MIARVELAARESKLGSTSFGTLSLQYGMASRRGGGVAHAALIRSSRELSSALAVGTLVSGVWRYGWVLWTIACTPREAIERSVYSATAANAWSFARPPEHGDREVAVRRLRLRPAACELVDGLRFGLIVDIDNPELVATGLVIPRVVLPVVSPQFHGETWGFDEAVAESPPDPNLVEIGESRCGPGPETDLVLGPSEHLARGWILERSLEPDMTLEIVASVTEFSPDTPWERRRELACFRLRAEVHDAACTIIEARDSPCHAPGAIYLDVGESVGVTP